MQHIELKVTDSITSCIRGIWYRNINLGFKPSPFEVLPDGHAEIVFHFGFGCNLLLNGQSKPLPSPFMVGLLNRPIYFESKGQLQIIGIKCLPWAVHDLLKLPSVNGGVQTFSHPIASLHAKLEPFLACGEINAALALVKNWCFEHLPTIAPEIKRAGQAMLAFNGSLPVRSVAEAANSTVRTLERKFKAKSGHTVKDVSSLIRFEQACNVMWKYPETRISALAHQFGYSDQSHLNREFRRYIGITAAMFAKQTRAKRKEFGDDFVAFVLSS